MRLPDMSDKLWKRLNRHRQELGRCGLQPCPRSKLADPEPFGFLSKRGDHVCLNVEGSVRVAGPPCSIEAAFCMQTRMLGRVGGAQLRC
jgi:hypothetical protein